MNGMYSVLEFCVYRKYDPRGMYVEETIAMMDTLVELRQAIMKDAELKTGSPAGKHRQRDIKLAMQVKHYRVITVW